MKKEIILNGEKITYTLTRKKVKNINLRINRDGEILVSANNFVRQSDIENFLISKSDFLINALKKRENLIKNTPKPLNLVSGENMLLWGENYNLSVFCGKNQVLAKENNIILSLKDPSDFSKKQKLIREFYKRECEEYIFNLCKDVFPIYEGFVKGFPEIKFKNMKSRWGSCAPQKNTLTFNIKLALLPKPLVIYVVVHEFTHFIEPNHQKNFYKQIEKVLPDYKGRQKLIKSYNLVAIP